MLTFQSDQTIRSMINAQFIPFDLGSCKHLSSLLVLMRCLINYITMASENELSVELVSIPSSPTITRKLMEPDVVLIFFIGSNLLNS